MSQVSSYELKRLHIAANAGSLVDSGDLLNEIRDLKVEVESLSSKLKRERSISKRLRVEVKKLKD